MVTLDAGDAQRESRFMIGAIRRVERHLANALRYRIGARVSLRASVHRLETRMAKEGAAPGTIEWLLCYVARHEAENYTPDRVWLGGKQQTVERLINDMTSWVTRNSSGE